MTPDAFEGLERLNAAPPAAARERLLACCGSRRWAERMLDERPFASVDALHAAAERIWRGLGPEDWLEAFATHPKIGERSASVRTTDGLEDRTAGWSAEEQSGAADAAAGTLERLAAANRAYEERFGFIFIVCATGKSAGEMLALLEARLGNERRRELEIAAAEQGKITRLRLDKLLAR